MRFLRTFQHHSHRVKLLGARESPVQMRSLLVLGGIPSPLIPAVAALSTVYSGAKLHQFIRNRWRLPSQRSKISNRLAKRHAPTVNSATPLSLLLWFSDSNGSLLVPRSNIRRQSLGTSIDETGVRMRRAFGKVAAHHVHCRTCKVKSSHR